MDGKIERVLQALAGMNTVTGLGPPTDEVGSRSS